MPISVCSSEAGTCHLSCSSPGVSTVLPIIQCHMDLGSQKTDDPAQTTLEATAFSPLAGAETLKGFCFLRMEHVVQGGTVVCLPDLARHAGGRGDY